jgi:hypothetical protein
MISLEFRGDALTEDSLTAMERQLSSLQERWDATFHIPGDPREIALADVLARRHFPQLVIRFPASSIAAS